MRHFHHRFSVTAAAALLCCLSCESDTRKTPASRVEQSGETSMKTDVSSLSMPETADETNSWEWRTAEFLDKRYGKPGMGMANQNPDAIIEYVARYPAQDHVVYVTSGASSHRFPHEFVMRVKLERASRETIGERAPMWPDHVLTELAEVEERTDRVFAPGDFISDMSLEGSPYRHFAVFKDPVLEPLHRPRSEPLFFLQVVPLSDAQLAMFNASPEGEPIPLMTAWSSRDPLLLVDGN